LQEGEVEMKKTIVILIPLFLFILMGCGIAKPTMEVDTPQIIPPNCSMRPGEEGDFTLDTSGEIDYVEWEYTKGKIINKTQSGRTITFKAPQDKGSVIINAVVHLKSGEEQWTQIKCEIDELNDSSTALPVEITQTTEGVNATIDTSVVVLYAGPDLSHKLVSGNRYRQGTNIIIFGKTIDNVWFLVKTPDNIIGWIYKDWFNYPSLDLSKVLVVSSLPTLPPPIQQTHEPNLPVDPTSTPVVVATDTVVPIDTAAPIDTVVPTTSP